MTRENAAGGFLTLDGSGEGICVFDLPPCTLLFVSTLNSIYCVVTTNPPQVRIQGGSYFPEPTAARLVGSSGVPGGPLKAGWIGIGLRLELRSRDRYVVTSAVRAIRTDRAAA